MRSQPSRVAERLRSVAVRYRSALAALGGGAGGRRAVAQRRLGVASDATVRPPFSLLGDGRDARLNRLEAVLFLAREPLNSRKLSQLAGLADGTEARTRIGQLNRIYDAHGMAFRVEQVAGGYQLLTRPQFAPWLRRLDHVPSETRLSGPALETLAVVAYRQPVLRADIEAIRGVSCGEILRQLMERELIRIGGRSEELGRPYLYATTKWFLQTFGLHNLDELPRAESLRGPMLAAVAQESEMQPDADIEINAGQTIHSHHEEES